MVRVQKKSPTVSEKIDGLKFIVTTHRALFSERVTRSYRLITLVCTFYLLAIVGRYGTYAGPLVTQALENPIIVWLIWALFLWLAAFSFFILWRSLYADAMNQRIAQTAENAILDIVAPSMEILPIKDRHKHINRYYLAWHAGFIFLLSIISATVVTLPLN